MGTWFFYIFLSIVAMMLLKPGMNKRTIIVGRYKVRINSFFLFAVFSFVAVFRLIESNGLGGMDAYAYLERFKYAGSLKEYIHSIKNSSILNIEEPLFKVYNIVLRNITANDKVYLFVSYGIITIALIGFVRFFYKENSFAFSLIMVTYGYLYSFNIMRSWLSIALCMYAFRKIVQQKWISSLVMIAIAGLIHTIAFSFVLVWAICLFDDLLKGRFKTRTLLLVALLANIVCMAMKSIIYGIVMRTKYSFYDKLFLGEASIWGYLPTIILCIVAISLFDRVKRDENNTELERRKKLYSILAITVNLSCMYLIVDMFAWRINDFFILIRMFAISIIYEYMREKYPANKGIVKLGIYGFTMAYFIQQMLGLEASSGVFPYILSFK